MSRYAQNTTVAADASRNEIERTLTRYGAGKFMYGWDHDQAMIAFEMAGRNVKFLLPLPDKNADEFRLTPTKKWERSEDEALKEWEKACRQRWRALALVVKAKLEAVESGITDFESEFLAHIMLPDGTTVGQTMIPRVALAYESGVMPRLELTDGTT